MKKLSSLLFIFSAFILFSFNVQARGDRPVTVGVYGLAQFHLVDSENDLKAGFGGGAFFNYRFNQKFSVNVDLLTSVHNGQGRSNGDDSQILLGLPTFTINLHFLKDDSSPWDPYGGIGLGLYILTEGDINNDSGGAGLGAHLTVGVDYYFSDQFSVGVNGTFRSIAVINSSTNATALIPFSIASQVGFHF